MKNKMKSLVLICGLLILVISLSACGYVSTRGDGITAIPHSVDWGFTNCLVCHADGDIAAPDSHALYTIDLCLNPACHPLLADLPTFTPTYTPPPTTTKPPTTTGEPPTTTGEPPTTTGEPPTTTATGSPGPISSDFHAGQTTTALCAMCHSGASPVYANPEDHADYADDSCFDAGCHEPPE